MKAPAPTTQIGNLYPMQRFSQHRDAKTTSASTEPFDQDGSTVRRAELQLLPRLGKLFLLNLAVSLIPLTSSFMTIVVLFPIIYLAVVLLATRDMMRCPNMLHPIDRKLCRAAGPVVVLLAAALLCLVFILIDQEIQVEDSWLATRLGTQVFLAVMECGVIFSMAVLCATRELNHVPPLWAWKICAVPLLLIYGAYLVLVQFARMLSSP